MFTSIKKFQGPALTTNSNSQVAKIFALNIMAIIHDQHYTNISKQIACFVIMIHKVINNSFIKVFHQNNKSM